MSYRFVLFYNRVINDLQIKTKINKHRVYLFTTATPNHGRQGVERHLIRRILVFSVVIH